MPKPITTHLLLLLFLHNLVHTMLTISSMTISAPSAYTIEITEFFTTVPAGAIIQLELPTEYSSDDLHVGVPYTGAQLDGFCPGDCGLVGVQYAGFVFNLTGMFQSADLLAFKYSILGVPNPRTAITVPGYTVRVIDTSATVIYTETINSRTFVPKAMTCTAMATDFTAVGFVSTAYFTINPTTNPSDTPMSLITLQLPSTWSGQPLTSTTLTPEIYCLSPTQPSLLCQRSSQIVTITGATFGSSIDFEIHSITSPTSMMSAGSVTVSTMTSSRVRLDSCTIGVGGFTQDYLLQPGMTVTYDSNTMMTVTISASFPARVAAGTLIMFTVPSELPLTGSSCSAFLAGNPLPTVTPSYSAPTNTITINPFTTLILKPSISIRCTGISRPRSAFTLSNITITSTYNGSTIAGASCCSTVLAARNSLNIVSLVTDKPYLQMSGAQYTVKLSNSVGLEVGDMVFVWFPLQYGIGVGSIPCTANSPSAVLAAPTCTVSPGNLVKISSFLTAPAAASTEFTFALSSIQNPSSNPSSTPFQIHLVSSQSQTIQSSSTTTVPISAATLPSLTVTSPNKQTLYSPAQYLIQFTTNGILGVNYYIVVLLPGEVGVEESKLVCSVGGKVWPCGYDSGGNSVEVRVIEGLASNNVNFVLSGGRNPESLAPTSNFNIQILDPNRNIIQISNPSGATSSITMQTLQTFKYLHLAILPTSSSTNIVPNIYQPNILQIIAVAGTKLKATHKFVVTYGVNQMVFNFGTGVSGCGGLVCGFGVGGVITVTGLPVGFDTIYLNITNSIGLVPRPTLTLTLTTTTDHKILQSTQSISQYNPDTISYTLTQSSSQYSSTSDITIDYTFNSLSTTGLSIVASRITYLLVYVPGEYGTTALGNLYNVTGVNGRVTITGVVNPAYGDRGSGYFYLEGFGGNGEMVAFSVNNKYFTPICDMPCRTCTITSPSNCLTCYTWHTLPLLHTDSTSNTSTCVSTCPRFYYQDATTSTCKPCDPNCYECAPTSGVRCLSCPGGAFLHEVEGKCYGDCPGGFWEAGGVGNDGVCRGCTGNCLTCLNDTYCYTCAVGLYLYANKCLPSCPPSTYSLTTPTKTCTNCPVPNCADCTQLQCIACKPPYYLTSNQCSLSCPFPLLPSLSGICKACQCASCTNYASNCTSCLSGKPYMYNNYCYAACPLGMYPGAVNMCTNCTLSCLTCTGATVCTLCKEGFALMSYGVGNVLCIATSTCPNTTILSLSASGVPSCLPCTMPCASCVTSVTFCLTCIDGYNFHNNTCVATCPAPYHSITALCLKCIPACLTCQPTDPYNCTQCQPTYYLANSTCYSSCPTGTYTDTLAKQCIRCASVCNSCANSTNCTSCISGYFLFNWFCYTSCPTVPTVYYQYNGVCSACQVQCVSCVDSPVACTACSHPDYLYNVVTRECGFECGSGYYRKGATCVACQPPCFTCDTTYNSCRSCSGGLLLYNGTCVSQCPIGYYSDSATCQKCTFPCKVCLANECLLCQSFSYMYQKSCVLSCPPEMPYQQPGYCSQCIGIGFCARCTSSTSNSQICSQCVYPYVLFQGTCLNGCPVNYTAREVDGALVCGESEVYLEYLRVREEFNKPILPSFLMFGLWVLMCLVVLVASNRVYRYTYNVGFMLSTLIIFNTIFTYYSLYFTKTRYEGQYLPLAPLLPFILLLLGILYNTLILTITYWFAVLKNIYTQDIRYQEWKGRNLGLWWVVAIGMVIFGGPRLHKLCYSKVFGMDRFAFRVVSVEKFYTEDIITYFSAIGDLLEITACIVILYNVFMTYNGLLLLSYQIIAFKLVLWMLILYDLKKPDRGFFIGDEQQAEAELQRQLEEEEKKLNRIDTEAFAKLIRTKSQEVLCNKKRFGDLDVDDFISVYNPEDYEEVPKVPNKKIEKNIYRGKYRKGRKITIQEKLHKFVDSIKPRPIIDKKKVDSYLHKLIYWKPPQMKKPKITPQELPPSEQSMLALLEKKQQEYKQDLDDIDLFDQKLVSKPPKYYARPRYNQHTFLDDLDQTIPNQTVQFFYPSSNHNHSHNHNSHTIQSAQKVNSIDFDDLMNLNYARRKHLDKEKEAHNEKLEYESKSKRKLHHEPQKKRKNLKGFGEMVLRNQY